MEFSRPTIAMAQQTRLELTASLRPIRTWKIWISAPSHHRSIRLPKATISIIRAAFRAQRIFRKTQLRRHCPNGWIWIALASTQPLFRNLPVPMCFACPKTIWFKYADSLMAFVCTTHCIRSKYSFISIVPHTTSLINGGCDFRALAPRLTIYVSFDGSSYHAIYLHASTTKELAQKMFKLPGFADYLTSSPTNIENSGFAGWSKWFSIAPLTSAGASTYMVSIPRRFAVKIFGQRIELVRRLSTEYLHLRAGRHSRLRHWRGARKHQGRKSLCVGNYKQQNCDENCLQEWNQLISLISSSFIVRPHWWNVKGDSFIFAFEAALQPYPFTLTQYLLYQVQRHSLTASFNLTIWVSTYNY